MGVDVETYRAQSAEVVIDGDMLTLTRKKIGKDDVRQIPLAAVTGVRLKPGGRFAPALLQLVLNGEPPADMTAVEPNTLVFPSTPKHKEALAGLHARLEAVAEGNDGGGPVAYDAPRKGLAERASDRLGEVSERLEGTAGRLRESAGRLGESAGRADAGGERVSKVDVELAEAGITRPDVVAAAHATANFFGMSIEIPPLARALRPDELLLRAARATVGDRIGMVAVTAARLIFLDEAIYERSYDEYPLTAIMGTSTESEFMSNALTLRMQSGHVLVLERVDDINGFTATLREAIHKAVTPIPASPPPPPFALPPPVGPPASFAPPPPFAPPASFAPPPPFGPPASFAPPPPVAPPAGQPDVLAQITKLSELHTAGILTDEEFQAKKTELLNRL